MMLPAGAFVNAAAGFSAMAAGNCTPTCVSSPVRGGLLLPAAAFVQGDGQLQVSAAGPEACSPSRLRTGALFSVMTASSPQHLMGDASTRSAGAACASPYMRGAGMMTGSDASARSPAAGAHWGFISSPCARGPVPAMQGIVSTSPMAAAGVSPLPALAAYGPAGSTTSDALRTILGPGGITAGDDLAAKLRAAAPETYED